MFNKSFFVNKKSVDENYVLNLNDLLEIELKEKIESTEVKISVKVGKEGKLFGSVSTKQITDAIQAKLGEKIDKRKIALDGPINSLGTYEIPIQLHKDVIAKIKLFIVEE